MERGRGSSYLIIPKVETNTDGNTYSLKNNFTLTQHFIFRYEHLQLYPFFFPPCPFPSFSMHMYYSIPPYFIFLHKVFCGRGEDGVKISSRLLNFSQELRFLISSVLIFCEFY